MSSPRAVEVRVPARVGLVGNPSDGFGGAVVAAVVDDVAAQVRVVSAGDGVSIRAPGEGPAGVDAGVDAGVSWPTPAQFVADIDRVGHRGTHRIVTAALRSLGRHCGRLPGVDIEWSSSIPRSVGLAGSSAIAVGVIEAVARSMDVEIAPPVVAALALQAETDELGIAAGWQDRVAQAFRCAVFVDAGEMALVDGVEVPSVVRLPTAGIDAVVAWRADDADDSSGYHAALRRRPDAELADAMVELTRLSHGAMACVTVGDHAGLAEFVDASWRVRVAAMPLRPSHAALVETARAAGAAATSPGSGGSVVAVPTDPSGTAATVDALVDAGATVITTRLR